MKNNQKGFSNLVLIGVLIVLVGVVSYFAWHQKSPELNNNLPTTTKSFSFVSPRKNDIWKIGESHQIVFSQPIPYDAHCVNQLSLIDSTGQDVGELSLSNEPNAMAKGNISEIWDGKYTEPHCGTSNVPSNTKPGKYRLKLSEEDTGYGVGKPLAVYSDYFVLQNSTCVRDQEATPVIDPLSKTSFSVGDTIKLHGCNFLGFEGDKDVWIENSSGVKGVLYGVRNEDNENLEFTLKSPICQTGNSYSGLPCEKYLILSPGVYKIYISPWSKKSNEVSITIK